MKDKLNEEAIVAMLRNADSPQDFRAQVALNLAEMGVWGTNVLNSLNRLYLTEERMKHSLDVSGEVLKESFKLAVDMYPNAVAGYGRIKSYISALKKLLEYDDSNEMFDYLALRILLCDDEMSPEVATQWIYRVLRRTMDHFTREKGFNLHRWSKKKSSEKVILPDEIREQIYIPSSLPLKSLVPDEEYFKDRVRHPKANGFQGLSMTLITPEGIYVELQLWTTSMAERNDFGSANHDAVYKKPGKIEELLLQKGDSFSELSAKRRIGELYIQDRANIQFPRKYVNF